MRLTALASPHFSFCLHFCSPPFFARHHRYKSRHPCHRKTPLNFVKICLLISSFLHLICLLYFQISAILFVIAICHLCKGNKHATFHLVRRCLCIHAHVAEDSAVVKQMCNDSFHRGPVMWASEPHMSLISTCAGHSFSHLLFHLSSIFTDLSIRNFASCRGRVTGSLFEHSSKIDRGVRKLIVSENTSAGARHYCSLPLLLHLM